MYDILELNSKLLPELKEIARDLGIHKVDAFRKSDLIYKILDVQAIKAAEQESDKKKQAKAQTSETASKAIENAKRLLALLHLRQKKLYLMKTRKVKQKLRIFLK